MRGSPWGGSSRQRPRQPRVTKPYVIFNPVYANHASNVRRVRVLLGDGAAKATATGGWDVISRAKNKGFTAWDGYEPYQMVVPVMFDGLSVSLSQESEYDALHSIMRVPVGPARQPSPVRLKGPVPMTNLLWVIQNIEPDDIIRHSRDGEMVRVSAVVTLLEYVEADVSVAIKPSPAKAAVERQVAAGNPPAARTYTVKGGDTLSKIAATHLGSYKRYPEIAKMNDIRDPNRISPGQVLRLP